MATMAPSRLRNWSLTFTYLLLSGLAVYYMHVIPQKEFGVSEYMETVIKTGRFPNGVALRRQHTGIAAVDLGLSYFMTAFIDGSSGWDPAFQLQQIYFLSSFFAVISIWEVEACRSRSGLAMGSLLFLWTLAYQILGGAVVIPSYYLTYTWITSRQGYFSLPREVPISVAKALLPALVIGYALPTVLLFWPWRRTSTVQAVTALWQPAPLFPILLLLVLPGFLINARPAASAVPADVRHLRRVYVFVGVLTTCVHFAVVYNLLTSTDPVGSFSQAFILDFAAAKNSPTKALHYIFQADFWIIFIACTIWCWQAVWDLKQMRAITPGLPQAAILIALASVAWGPGAVMCAVWYWREGKMVTLSQKVAKRE